MQEHFMSNMEVYAGKQSQGPHMLDNIVSSVVTRLMEPIDKSGRNITMNNFYTFVPLAIELYFHHRTTIVGTLKKREIPELFTDVKGRPVGSSMFAFGVELSHTMLVSFIPTFHDEDTIDPESIAGKPELPSTT